MKTICVALLTGLVAMAAPGVASAGHRLASAAQSGATSSVEHGVRIYRAPPRAWQSDGISARTVATKPQTVRIVWIVRADYLAVDTRPRGDRQSKFRFYGNF